MPMREPSNEQDPKAPPATRGEITRRTFVRVALTAAGAGWAAALGYPLYLYLDSPARKAALEAAIKDVTLDGADTLPAGSAMMFKFGGRPALLIHLEDGSWSALTAVCTHLGCTVQYESDKRRIYCACHGGVYDPKTGGNVSGPPPKPLRQFKVDVAQGKVTVSRA
jgi:cytochrome b6-f complex iron-sulfur subunit